MYQTGQNVPLACGHVRTVAFNDSFSADAKLWCGPCDRMRDLADTRLPYRQQLVPGGPVVPVRYANTRAVAAYAAKWLARGQGVAIWPSDDGRRLWAGSDPDPSRIELGTRADTWDDWDAWLWRYPVAPASESDRSDDLITVDLETWIHANTRDFFPPDHLADAREWIADCQWDDDVDSLTDAQVIAGVNRHYAGGWAQFTADGDMAAGL